MEQGTAVDEHLKTIATARKFISMRGLERDVASGMPFEQAAARNFGAFSSTGGASASAGGQLADYQAMRRQPLGSSIPILDASGKAYGNAVTLGPNRMGFARYDAPEHLRDNTSQRVQALKAMDDSLSAEAGMTFPQTTPERIAEIRGEQAKIRAQLSSIATSTAGVAGQPIAAPAQVTAPSASVGGGRYRWYPNSKKIVRLP
jgi:hypothetical protein